MDIKRHHHWVEILQFLAMFAFFVFFFLSIDFLKSHGWFNPALFLMGPLIAAFVCRLVFIFSFAPDCTERECSGRMILNPVRTRQYFCNHCLTKVRVSKTENDPNVRSRVNKLLLIALGVVLTLVATALFLIIKNAV